MSGEAGGQDKGQNFNISRILDAPRNLVWQALTEPDRMKDWWTPQTFTMISMNMDFRPGGFFHMGMRSGEGFKMWGKFVYQEIAPPERLVFVNSFSNAAGDITKHPIVPTWPRETLITVQLVDEPGGKTKLDVRWTPHNASDVERNTFAAGHVGMKATWTGTFDRLAAYLATTQ
jgi:uncharacterized protein YndB with AHSA1/START domain